MFDDIIGRKQDLTTRYSKKDIGVIHRIGWALPFHKSQPTEGQQKAAIKQKQQTKTKRIKAAKKGK
jgi:hypothetical protein